MKAAALTRMALGLVVIFATGAACAQAGKGPTQVVKPPVSQAWIDVATFTGMGMPSMGAGGGSPMSMMGSMFGGGQGGKNTFGMTQTGSAGRWVDVTLYTSRNPNLAEAAQAVPAGTQLAPTLKLVSPKIEKGSPPTPETIPWSNTSTNVRRERCTCTGVAGIRCGRDSRVCSTWRPRVPRSTASSSLRAAPRSVVRTVRRAARCGRTRSIRAWCRQCVAGGRACLQRPGRA